MPSTLPFLAQPALEGETVLSCPSAFPKAERFFARGHVLLQIALYGLSNQFSSRQFAAAPETFKFLYLTVRQVNDGTHRWHDE
jgi:hypothetical protein